MKKFLYKGEVWKLAGYHKNGRHVLIWMEGFDGHGGDEDLLVHKIDPEVEGKCWWVSKCQLKPYIEMEENE